MKSVIASVRHLLGLRHKREILPDHVRVGRHTYGITRNIFQGLSSACPVEIGAFCSFADDVRIFCKAGHPTHLVSTYPFRTLMLHPEKGNQDAVTKGPVRIGNDVWVGTGATILDGITIEDGAVIAAGTVVARDVPAYAIVGGNPARIIRHRFTPEIVTALCEIAWWDWSDEKIRAFETYFYGDVEEFIAAARIS